MNFPYYCNTIYLILIILWISGDKMDRFPLKVMELKTKSLVILNLVLSKKGYGGGGG